jgi:CO dehydrogenase nickel-insertion accessory protein CooC1
MILGFLGKGGSGKSSLATQVALWLHAQKNNQMLAIDADHNMDLVYNLFNGDIPENMPYFGAHLEEIMWYAGLDQDQKYDEAFLKQTDKRFSLVPKDRVTHMMSIETSENMHVMAAGPQTEIILYGQSCSHILTTPLKVYLPLLELQENQYVVVDEKAGADGVTTGIVTGIDVGVIVCEPALHSIKTALQIAELMDFYETPYIFVGNKIQSSEDKEFIERILGKAPACYLLESNHIKRDPGMIVHEWSDEMATIIQKAKTLSNNDRLRRTQVKFTRNKEFKNS